MKQGSEQVMLATVLLEREEIVSAVWEAIWHYLPELNICFPYVSTAPRIHPREKLLHMCPGNKRGVMFVITLLARAESYKQTAQYPQTNEYINRKQELT